MVRANRIYILMNRVNKLFSFFHHRIFYQVTETFILSNFHSCFYNSIKNSICFLQYFLNNFSVDLKIDQAKKNFYLSVARAPSFILVNKYTSHFSGSSLFFSLSCIALLTLPISLNQLPTHPKRQKSTSIYSRYINLYTDRVYK